MEEIKEKEQTFRFKVNSSGERVTPAGFKFLDRAEEVIGICVSSDRFDLAYFRGNFEKIDIDSKEWLKDYDASMLIPNASVAPDQKYKSVDAYQGVGGKAFDVVYQDNEHPQATFSPYTVRIHAKLRMRLRD